MSQKEGAPLGNKNRQTHGLAGTRIYKIWQNMKRRCDKPNYYQYHRYGGRGITYEPRWAKFENFYEDMKDTYQDTLTIERVDVNGNYCKENCKWIPMSEQKNNTSKSHWITIDDDTKSLKDWALMSGVKYTTALMRLKRGWSPKDSFEIGG